MNECINFKTQSPRPPNAKVRSTSYVGALSVAFRLDTDCCPNTSCNTKIKLYMYMHIYYLLFFYDINVYSNSFYRFSTTHGDYYERFIRHEQTWYENRANSFDRTLLKKSILATFDDRFFNYTFEDGFFAFSFWLHIRFLTVLWRRFLHPLNQNNLMTMRMDQPEMYRLI